MSCLIGQLRWHGETGTLKPRSRWPTSIFIGALSTTLRPISARTWACEHTPTGRVLREKIPPSGSVTMTAPAPVSTMRRAASSTDSPASSSGTGRITSATRTLCRSAPLLGMSASSPTVPAMRPRSTTLSGSGCWPRSRSMTSARESSGSHSAPSGAAMRSRSGIGRGSDLGGEEGGHLAGGDHADRALVVVHHQRRLALLAAQRGEHVEQPLALVDEQRRGAQDVARGDLGDEGTDQVAAGDHHVTVDQPLDD